MVDKYADKIASFYLPKFSLYYKRTVAALGKDIAVAQPVIAASSVPIARHKAQFTTFDDVYGHLFLTSNIKEHHDNFLITHVIPHCLEYGGMLVLSDRQHTQVKHLLDDPDIVNVINCQQGSPTPPLEWDEGVNISTLSDFFSTGLLEGDIGELHEGFAVGYLHLFFEVWDAVGIELFPHFKVNDFSLPTLASMLDVLGPEHGLTKRVLNLFDKQLTVDSSSENTIALFTKAEEGYINAHVMLQNKLLSITQNHTPPDSVALNRLFDDMHTLTVLVYTEEETGDALLEKACINGVLNILRSRLRVFRRNKILYGVPSPRYTLYTSPSSPMIHREHALFSAHFSDIVRNVTAALVDLSDEPDDAKALNAILLHKEAQHSEFDELEYAELKRQADNHIELKG